MRTSEPHCPNRFDVIRLQLSPHAGHEQADKFCFLVLSPFQYNHRTRFCILCPITTQIKGYPFEVTVPYGGKMTGAVLSDQVNTIDWYAGGSEFVEHRPDIAPDVLGKLRAVLTI